MSQFLRCLRCMRNKFAQEERKSLQLDLFRFDQEFKKRVMLTMQKEEEPVVELVC